MKTINQKLISIVLAALMLMSALAANIMAVEYPNDSSWLGDETKDAFYDVTNDQWYAEYANEAYHRGLFEGTYPNEWVRVFLPNDMFTREQAVALLLRIDQGEYNKLGSTGTFEPPFTDVPSNAWYAYYVRWAKLNGITTGITDSLFGTGNAITREELATMISRYVDFKKISLKVVEDAVEAFSDADEVSEWARDAVELMRKSGILRGDENGNVRPQDVITRAEAAVMLVRADSALGFDMSHLLGFSDDDVASVKFIYQNNSDRKEIDVTESTEVKDILENLRDITIADTKSTSGIVGVGKFIEIADENGVILFSAIFTPDSMMVDDHRIFYLDSAYLQEYCDMLEQDSVE